MSASPMSCRFTNILFLLFKKAESTWALLRRTPSVCPSGWESAVLRSPASARELLGKRTYILLSDLGRLFPVSGWRCSHLW